MASTANYDLEITFKLNCLFTGDIHKTCQGKIRLSSTPKIDVKQKVKI